MKISNIKIKNYKGFEDCTVDFHPKMNVFIGNNASGKTTLLKAILKSVYSIINPFAPNMGDVSNLILTNEEINYNHNTCYIQTTINEFPKYKNEIIGLVNTNPMSNDILSNINHIDKQRREFHSWLNNNVRQTTVTIPIFKYYPANRGAIQYAQTPSQANYLISQLETWSNIYQDSLSYSRFFTWYLENETNELFLQRDNNDFNLQNPALRDVRKALHEAFEFLGYKDVTIKSQQIKRMGNSKLTPTLVLEKKGSKKSESLENKSDGEKAIITLIVDIAYNLSLAKNFLMDDYFLNSPGIVMIDEIETHLHPTWQRKIMPMLTKIFPNIQFFAATHSPQIISSIKSESVFVCDNFKIGRVSLKTLGEDTNSLLKYIFNSTERPEKYIALIKKFDALIEENATESELLGVIMEIKEIDKEDTSSNISNLIDELNMQLTAYKFDKEHEESK